MNKTFTFQKAETLEVVLLGFETEIFDFLAPPPDSEPRFFFFNRFNNVDRLKAWTTGFDASTPNRQKTPYAIICNERLISKSGFEVAHLFHSNPHLQHVPFIVWGAGDRPLNITEALNHGIDDWYVGKVSWKDVHTRIKFLRKYKAELHGLKLPEDGEDQRLPAMQMDKRVFDIVFASVALLLAGPLMLLIALLVKLESKGPVLYFSKRVGTGYRVFNFIKFRSMCQDADNQLNKVKHLNHYCGSNGDGTFIKIQNDPRVTRVGRIIRKTSLDELPQLFNVLRGEMSIVGNRPLPLYEAELLTKDASAKRFWAPAGITGLWQTSGKGKDNMSVEERVKLDIQYAESFSFLLDTKILSRTLPAMIQKS